MQSSLWIIRLLVDLYILFGAVYLTYVRLNKKGREQAVAKRNESPNNVRASYVRLYSTAFYVGVMLLASSIIMKLSAYPIYRIDHAAAKFVFYAAKPVETAGFGIIIASFLSSKSARSKSQPEDSWKPPM